MCYSLHIAINICINCIIFTFIFPVLLQQKLLQLALVLRSQGILYLLTLVLRFYFYEHVLRLRVKKPPRV